MPPVPSLCCPNTKHVTMAQLSTLCHDDIRPFLVLMVHSACWSLRTYMYRSSIGGDLWASKFYHGSMVMKTGLRFLLSPVTPSGLLVGIWKMTQSHIGQDPETFLRQIKTVRIFKMMFKTMRLFKMLFKTTY